MSARRPLAALADVRYDGERLERRLAEFMGMLRLGGAERREMRRATRAVVAVLDERGERTLQQRWEAVEVERWPAWNAGRDRLAPTKRWTWGTAALVLSRAVRPGWIVLPRARLSQWLAWLPAEDPLRAEFARLQMTVADVEWSAPEAKRRAALLGLRVLLAGGRATLEEITGEDLQRVPVRSSDGINTLDAVLCQLGVLDRTPQQGAQRRLRRGRLSPAELVAGSRIPERFRAAHQLYLETYAQRISDVYATMRHKHNSLEHLWAFLDEHYPAVRGSAEVRREHLLAFIPHAIERARQVQRRQPHLADEDRLTAHQWLVNVRCFFADVCVWSTEPGLAIRGPRAAGGAAAASRPDRRRLRQGATSSGQPPAGHGARPRARGPEYPGAGVAVLAGRRASARRCSGRSGGVGGRDRRILGLGAARVVAAVRVADRGGLRAHDAGRPQAPPARRQHLLPAACQAVEV
jgi:hypothetical protein